MSGGPKLRSMNVAADPETRPVLGPAGNKTRSVTATARKPISKPLRKADRAVLVEAEEEEEKKKKKTPARASDSSPPVSPSLGAPAVLRRQELLLRSNLSLNASCSSDCSTESFRSRSSTGRIGRPSLTSRRKNVAPKPEKIAAKLEKIVPDGFPESILQGKRRCAWITPNTDPLYAAFHDEEWGVPVHNDKKLFELLVLSGALAELTWPAILSKRHIFREVFMDFDPLAVSKLNERRIIAPGSTASSLLSEPKLRAIIENAHQILKITEECGSFDRYCWSFVNYNPIISRFRYPRQIPVKTPKADVISKDLVRRGFRFVGPTVIYSFMQATGITNDHLINCFRFEECCVNEKDGMVNGNHKVEEKSFVATTGTGSDTSSSPTAEQKIVGIDLDLNGVMNDLGISG